MRTPPIDVVVFDKDGRPVLIVEIKDGRLFDTTQSAAELRQSLIEHRLLPEAPFFMVATPIQIYLWYGDAHPGAEPAYCASAKSILEAYFPQPADAAKEGIHRDSLESVILFWLSDIASGIRPALSEPKLQHMVFDSGLFERMKGGAADFDVQL